MPRRASRSARWNISAATTPRSSHGRESAARSSPMYWPGWSSRGAARWSIIPNAATAAASVSATTSCRPTGAFRSPTRTKNSRAWPPISPTSSWPTAPAARCSLTSGSTPSPKWRGSPTARTGAAFRCSPTRRWPDWCWVTTPGNWGCRCTRWTWNRCSKRWA